MGADNRNVPFGAGNRRANALSEWHEWVRANPKATPREATHESARIVVSHSILDANKMAATARPMRYAVGERLRPNLDATSAATEDALEAGEITPEEYDEQALRIEIWEAIEERRQQAEAARELEKD